MPSSYWEEVILGIDEVQLQDLLTEVYTNKGWQVKNMHRVDPKSENGADLELRKVTKKILVAVKEKPKTSDIDQLKRLWQRRSEAELVYAYSKPSTGGFATEAERLSEDIKFLHGKELHDFLIEGESITYLQSIFEIHPLIQEYAEALSMVWSCKHIEIPEKSTRKDFLNLYSLKQAVLKKRAAVNVFSLKYDEYVNSLIVKDSEEFPKILDEIISNLNLVQRFAGVSLFETFAEVARTTPQLFARLWNIISQRTYWGDYARETGKLSNTQDVSEFTAKYWILPSSKAIGEAKTLSGNAIGFLSGLSDILKSLSRSLRDIDVAVDWLWANIPMKF